jgi:MerR family transcriptional regulator, light-induced transcriptional regulator
MKASGYVLSPAAMLTYVELRQEAIAAVTARFYRDHPSVYERAGERGRKACAQDLAFHLDFLRPVLETGFIEPLRDYLRWLENVLESRNIPADHLFLSVQWLSEFYEARLARDDAANLRSLIEATRQALQEPAPEFPPYYRHMPEPWPQTEAFRTALLAGDHRQARTVFAEVIASGKGFSDTELHVIQAAMYQIGVLWQQNLVTVAQEHLATAICHAIMAAEFSHTPVALPRSLNAVLACLAGNHHAMGLRMVGDALELKGWEVMFLGADTPTLALVEMARDTHPDLVCLSVTLPYHLRAAREAIATIRETLGKAAPVIMVGGLAINQFTGLADLVNADAYCTDALNAATVAEALCKA